MTERRDTDPDALTSALVVLRCQAGDERAFAELMERFSPRTLGYLRGLVGEDAEDVQQEVWLAVYRHVASLADVGAFRTWLFRTARHRAIDHLRRRHREREFFVEGEDVEVIAAPGDVPGDSIDLAAVGELLGHLTAVQREALVLRYRDDMSYAEIALVVGCSVGTVRSRLFYGRQRLVELLTAHGPRGQAPGASIERGTT
jgi:RNA polymerase sigma-70 factor (ECF subfamily)